MNFLLVSFGAGVEAPSCTGTCSDESLGVSALVLLSALTILWIAGRALMPRLRRLAAAILRSWTSGIGVRSERLWIDGLGRAIALDRAARRGKISRWSEGGST